MDLFALDHDDLVRLRASSPVHFERGLWVVSRYADVRAVLADPVTYLPDNALTAVTPVQPAALRELVRARFSLPPTLANNGTESHTGMRRLVASFLTPARVAAMEPRIEELVHERLPALDLVRDLAWDLPCIVLLELLGLDGVDVPALKAWSTASLEFFWGDVSPARQLELAPVAGEFHQWLVRRFLARDGALFEALADHGVSSDEAAGLCYFLLIAGQETTTQLLSTVLYRALSSTGGLARAGARAEEFVEETLRVAPPVVTWRRVTSRPVVLSGVAVPAGAQLLLMLAGTPDDPGRHLAFGYGRHYCLGAGLARLEAAVVLRTVASRLPELRLATSEPPPMLELLSFRAPLEVLVDDLRRVPHLPLTRPGLP